MIITRTPLRMSFLGGGSDFAGHFQQHGGAVLSTALHEFVYVTVSPMREEFHRARYKLAYSKVESVNRLEDIEHPAMREAIRISGHTDGLELHTVADLPASTGLGSSSSFVAGMVLAIAAHAGRTADAKHLAEEAIRIERDLLAESGGIQDQVAAAYGGFNLIEFSAEEPFSVTPLALSETRVRDVESHCQLFYTGITRNSFDVHREAHTERVLRDRSAAMCELASLAREGAELLKSEAPIEAFGDLLHQGWEIKRSTTNASLPSIDAAYEAARRAGASGGKLLGAGQGGFLLIWAAPQHHEAIRDALHPMEPLEVKLNAPGASVIHPAS